MTPATISPGRQLVKVALPIVAGSLVTTVLTGNDTFLLGRFGAVAVAAAGTAVSIQMVCAVLIAGLGIAAQITVARHIGAKDDAAAARAAANTAVLATGAGVLLMIALLLSAGAITGAIVGDPALAADAAGYLRVLALGLPFVGLGAALRGFASGTGRTGIVLITSCCAGAADIGLAFALIHGGAGPIGVAIATSAATALSSTVLIAWLRRQRRTGLRTPMLSDIREWRTEAGTVWRIGWPESAQLGLGTLSMVFVVALIAPYGPDILAAARTLDVVIGTVSTVLYGCGSAVTILAGQRHGARDDAGLRRTEDAGRRFVGAVAAIAFVLGLPASPVLLRLLVDDPRVAAAATAPILLLAWAQPLFMAAIAVTNAVLRATGDTKTGLYASLAAEYLIFLPIGVLLCRILDTGLTGLYAAHLAYWAVYLAVVIRRRMARSG